MIDVIEMLLMDWDSGGFWWLSPQVRNDHGRSLAEEFLCHGGRGEQNVVCNVWSMMIITMESHVASSGLLQYRGASQGIILLVAVPHLLNYNLGVH